MVYYLGSDVEAPLTAPWNEATPGFYVSEPEPHEMAVRAHLPYPCIRYLGAHSGCGCGFRRDIGGYVEQAPEEEAATRADHEALVRYLRSLPEQSRPMQIYGCWSGDEAEPAEFHGTCPIEELLSPDFAFRERELITLIS